MQQQMCSVSFLLGVIIENLFAFESLLSEFIQLEKGVLKIVFSLIYLLFPR